MCQYGLGLSYGLFESLVRSVEDSLLVLNCKCSTCNLTCKLLNSYIRTRVQVTPVTWHNFDRVKRSRTSFSGPNDDIL